MGNHRRGPAPHLVGAAAVPPDSDRRSTATQWQPQPLSSVPRRTSSERLPPGTQTPSHCHVTCRFTSIRWGTIDIPAPANGDGYPRLPGHACTMHAHLHTCTHATHMHSVTALQHCTHLCSVTQMQQSGASDDGLCSHPHRFSVNTCSPCLGLASGGELRGFASMGRWGSATHLSGGDGELVGSRLGRWVKRRREELAGPAFRSERGARKAYCGQ